MKIYRATISSYLLLCGAWVALCIGYSFLYLQNPRGDLAFVAVATCCVAMSWCIWLRGFKVTISDEKMQYRDGFYKSSKIDTDEIAHVRTDWILRKVFGYEVKILRIVVVARDGEPVIKINPKPFSRSALTAINSVILHTKSETAST